MSMRTWECVASAVTAIGALNWGLWAIFRFNLVQALLGWVKPVEDLVYIVVGIAGLATGYRLLKQPQEPRVFTFWRRAA